MGTKKQKSGTKQAFYKEPIVIISLVVIIALIVHCCLLMSPAYKKAVGMGPSYSELLDKVAADEDVSVEDFSSDVDFSTLLKDAIAHNAKPELIDALIKKGADAKQRVEDGQTLLMLAAKKTQQPEVLRLLMEAGVSIDSKDEHSYTALDIACQYNSNESIIDYLWINSNSAQEELDYCFFEAGRYNTNFKILDYLKDKGANINAYRILSNAIENNPNEEVLFTLLNYGISLSPKKVKDGYYLYYHPLYLAIKKKKSDRLILALLEAGANPNLLCTKGTDEDEYNVSQTCFDWGKEREDAFIINHARDFGYGKNIIEDLLKHGAKVNDPFDWRGVTYNTPLLKEIKKRQPDPEIIKLLIEYGAKVNQKYEVAHGVSGIYLDSDYTSPLEYVLSKDSPDFDLINVLLEAGAKVTNQEINVAKKNPKIANSELYGILLDKRE